jgi:hypothetical protein
MVPVAGERVSLGLRIWVKILFMYFAGLGFTDWGLPVGWVRVSRRHVLLRPPLHHLWRKLAPEANQIHTPRAVVVLVHILCRLVHVGVKLAVGQFDLDLKK